MYEYNQVINGIVNYIDSEIISKITGWQKWVIGSGTGIALSKGVDVFNQLKKEKIIKTLGIIDKDDKIDVDLIYKEMKKQAQKSSITFNVPLVGALTLTEQDVETIYNLIKKEG